MSTRTTLLIAAVLIAVGLLVGVGLAVLAPQVQPPSLIDPPGADPAVTDDPPEATDSPTEEDGSRVPTGAGADQPSRGGWPRFDYEPYQAALNRIDWPAAGKLLFRRRSDLIQFARDSKGRRPSSEDLLLRLRASSQEVLETFDVVDEGTPAADHASVLYHPAFLANAIAVMLHLDGEPLTVAQVRELAPLVRERAAQDDELPSPRDPDGWALDALRREVVHRAAFRDAFFEYLTARQRRAIGAGEFTGWIMGDVLEPGSVWTTFMYTSYVPQLTEDTPAEFNEVDLFFDLYAPLAGLNADQWARARPVFESWMKGLPPDVLRYPATPATGGGAFPARHASLMAQLQVEIAQRLADAVDLDEANRQMARRKATVLIPLNDADS